MINDVIYTSPDILSGTPVFRGTRVPIKNLFDYIESGETLEEFLEAFPSVKKEQAIKVLEIAERVLTSSKFLNENFA
ncbi:MAG: DUF433 domain-containing protein [Bacteroidetes bacterium]|nr:DUF433 domain-containing protein [Bacteroidota bacterium]